MMSYEYVANGEKVVLEVDEDLIAVRFTEPSVTSTRAEVAGVDEVGSFAARFEIPEEQFTILPVAQYEQARHQRYLAAVAKMEESDQVERVAPVFKHGELLAVATDRLLLGVNISNKAAKKLLREHGLTILEEFGENDEFMVQLKPDVDPFEMIGKLSTLPEIKYVEPDFVVLGKHTQRLTAPRPSSGDPLLPQQYAMKITKAVNAWAVGAANPTVKIAILDEGVDTQHEDLKAAIVGGYDATDNDEYQEPNAWDGHGTACAGLAAGVANNDLGIRGIGGGCSLLAIRMAYSPSQGAGWITNDNWIRRGIDWAWRNKADVLSNSWGGGLPSSAITNAFNRARTLGRNGKGCVVVIAAGNGSGAVTFPATMNNVLAVSASNEFDEFKTKTSSDGENWWGSDFGPEISVAAPGVHNYTTDIMGAAGYNNAGHYIPNFNGTSSSTPIVAGAAALVLSANGSLSEAQVRQIICDTADKVGALPYFNGRNDQMGYGRVNVLRAVETALQQNGANGNSNGNVGPQPYVGKNGHSNGHVEEAATGQELTAQERTLLVEQALSLIDNFYVHLPLKRAMHAIDPAQRLKLLKHRLPKLNDRRFHSEMLSIFTSLRDLHTNYMLPEPYNRLGTYLPFLLEEFYEGGVRKYMASKTAAGFSHPTFVPGVVVTHWNGMPIETAVANNADRNAGSNEDARRARGLEGLTIRPLIMSLPPDEEWVDVRYEGAGGTHDHRFTWQDLPIGAGADGVFAEGDAQTASNIALDVQTEAARRMKKMLFAPAAMQVEEAIARGQAQGADAMPVEIDLAQISVLPDNFVFRIVQTPNGPVGYIRIYSFYAEDNPNFVEQFIEEFQRILGLMPANGLIVDVRGNGGGYITAGEKILQMLTPERIAPERLQFVNTPLTLQLCSQTEWLSQWTNSVQLSVETGDIFSQGFPLESEDEYNRIGRKYNGPVTLITDALCYSTTDIFAAGFQDHKIGEILGVHNNTGAGGANVWTHGLLMSLLPNETTLKPLPKKANFRVAIRRTSRVGDRAGLPVEDLGVVPNQTHDMTRRDLLESNADLITSAASLLFN